MSDAEKALFPAMRLFPVMRPVSVIAGQRVRASRGPMTGSAKRSGLKEDLDCFVAP
jgi:hypothetical protein